MKKSNISLKSKQTFSKIINEHTNTSVSKQTHSFSKSARFALPRPTCQEHYYAGEEVKSRRFGISIGSGQKSDFTKVLTVSPGCGKYTMKSQIDQKMDKKKGYLMGLGREKMSIGNYISSQLCKTPSSDRYKISLINKPLSPVYSLRPKTKQINKTMTIESQNQNPGPCDYLNPELNYSSRASKFATISYGTTKSQRFINQKPLAPGPGAYRQISSFSNVGKYVVSQHIGGTGAKFSNSLRVTKFDQIMTKSGRVPGVGLYEMPSQFGCYRKM